MIHNLESFSVTLHAKWRISWSACHARLPLLSVLLKSLGIPFISVQECVQMCLEFNGSVSWQDVDIDLKKSNQETLHEAGCLLLSDEIVPSSEVPSRYTRIRSLQRLKVSYFNHRFCLYPVREKCCHNYFCQFRGLSSEMRENFNQLKTKHTITVFLGGAYFCHLLSLHVCQHGWRSRRKTTGDGWETTRLQTLPTWTSAVSLCVLGLEPWLPLHYRDVCLHWESKFCCFGFKHRVTLWPNSQRICHRWLPNFI